MGRKWFSPTITSVVAVLAFSIGCVESKYIFGLCDFERHSHHCDLHGSHHFEVTYGKPEHNYDAMDGGYSGSGYLYLSRTNYHATKDTSTLTAGQANPVASFAYWINGAGEDSYLEMGVSRRRHHGRSHHHDHDHDYHYERLWSTRHHQKSWIVQNVTLPVTAGESFKVVWKAYSKKDEWLQGKTFIGLDDLAVIEEDKPCMHPPGLPFAKPWVCTEPHRLTNSNAWSSDPRQVMHAEGTVCKTECLPGFTIEGQPQVVCRAGEWHEPEGNVVFFCFDIEPPQFAQCPTDLNVSTPYGWATYPTTIGTPLVSDNSGLWTVQLTLDGQPEESNPTKDLAPGAHNVSFVAQDSYGNENYCSYLITVELSDTTPPTVVSCPKSRTIETSKPISLTYEEPEFADDTGHIAKIESTLESGAILSWGRYDVSITAYDNSSNSVSCEFVVVVQGIPCERLHVPMNGALVCHESYAGGFCVSMCGAGQDFTILPGLEMPSDYLCNTRGSWYPFDYTFDCTDPRGDAPALSGNYYYDTPCNETLTQEELQGKALEVYQLSGADITTGADLKPEDFFVSCGLLEI